MLFRLGLEKSELTISVLGFLGLISIIITIGYVGYVISLIYPWLYLHMVIFFCLLLFGIIWFIINLVLQKKTREQNSSEGMRILKITIIVFAALEVAGSLIMILVMMSELRFLFYSDNHNKLGVFVLCLCLIMALFYLIFTGLVIRGISKNRMKLVESYIIFNISLMVITLMILAMILVLRLSDDFIKIVLVVIMYLQVTTAFCIHLGFSIISYMYWGISPMEPVYYL